VQIGRPEGMKQVLKPAAAFGFMAVIAMMNAGCHSTHDHSHGSSGTHRMGTPKENYQMSNEQMPSGQTRARKAAKPTDGSGTHRMGTPKENYQMSNEQMRR
jgi:hypothetical protein